MRSYQVFCYLLATTLCLSCAEPDREALWRSHGDAGMEAYSQGNYAEAEKQLKASLEEARSLGQDNKYLILSLNRLALLYSRESKTAEAEELFKQALEIRERVFGLQSVAVAMSSDYLAELYMEQGKYEDAEHFYQRSVAIFEKAMGPMDASLIPTLEAYSILLQKMQRNSEAMKLAERAKLIRAAGTSQKNPINTNQ